MEKLLTATELAKRLNVHIEWIYARTQSDSYDPIPVIRMGKKGRLLRFDIKEIEAWMRKSHA